MNVSELFDLTVWIQNEIVEKAIPRKYQTLQQILQNQSNRNQAKQPFEAEKIDLINTLEGVQLSQLSQDQMLFLEKLGLAENIGKLGIEALEDILYKNVIDVATSAQKLQEKHQKIVEGIQKSEQISTGLDNCVLEEQYESDDEILMRVCFTGDALMKNIKDLKSWGNTWYDIGRGVAMAHNRSPEDIKVVGATKGSIILELAVIASIAGTVSGIILSTLKVAEKVLDIRNKAEGLKGLKLRNNQITADLLKEAEKEKDDGIKKITIQVVNELKIDIEQEGDKVKALNKSVKNLVEFIEKGGVVDFIAPEDSEIEDGEEDKHAALKVAFKEIRKLEKKLELLEHKEP